jgi:methyltransferase (TIGR00027 family)
MLENVSDTALWVAHYRAKENTQSKPLFIDPFAEILAGHKGKKIAQTLGFSKFMTWMMAMRTWSIDLLINKSVEEGIDCVLNLGAGLDTRPYRMKLPKDLKWIEADHATILDYKTQTLRSFTPNCALERFAIDVSNREKANSFYKNVASRFKKVLVITEGVIPYLEPMQAKNLADDLVSYSSFHFWIQDFRNGVLSKLAPKRWQRLMKNTPFRFDVTDSILFFTKCSWKAKDILHAAEVGDKHKRPFPIPIFWKSILWAFPKDKVREKLNSSGYVRFERTM